MCWVELCARVHHGGVRVVAGAECGVQSQGAVGLRSSKKVYYNRQVRWIVWTEYSWASASEAVQYARQDRAGQSSSNSAQWRSPDVKTWLEKVVTSLNTCIEIE